MFNKPKIQKWPVNSPLTLWAVRHKRDGFLAVSCNNDGEFCVTFDSYAKAKSVLLDDVENSADYEIVELREVKP